MSTEANALGKVEFVPPRNVWPNEARDFSPWLFENAAYLQDTLGIDIELDQAEHPVGDFSLDLFGRDLTNDCVLIVENQLERSDHTHLGQLLTYAAGTNAGTVVWVATEFRTEHLDAINFLNETSAGDLRFFALRLRVLKIGGSPAAPYFEVASQPSDWSAQLRKARRSYENQDAVFYAEFWDELFSHLKSEYPEVTSRSSNSGSNAYLRSKNGAELSVAVLKKGASRCEILMCSTDADMNFRIFEHLKGQKADIESDLGLTLNWEEMDGRKSCRISVSSEISLEEDRQGLIHWISDTAKSLYDVFIPRLAALPQEVISGPQL